MNNLYYYDACAIIIIAVLMHIIYSRKNIESRTRHMLLAMMIATTVSAIGDFFAAIVENGAFAGEYAIPLAYAANYIYFVAHPLIFPIYVLYIYASFDLWNVFKKQAVSKVVWWSLIAGDLLLLVVNPFTHWIFYISENVEYVRGPLLYIYYIVALIYAGWGIGTIIHHRAYATKIKITVMLLTFAVTFLALIIQMINSKYLVESFAIALLMMFFIIVIHRNENPIDPYSGAMKYYRALERAEGALDYKRPFVAVFVKITNYNNIRMYFGRDRFVKYLNTLSNRFREIAISDGYLVDVYYLENGTYAMFCDDDDKDKAKSYAEKVLESCNEICTIDKLKIVPNAAVCVVRCPDDIDEIGTLLSVSTSFSTTLGDSNGIIDYADYKDSKEFIVRNNLNSIIKKGLEENRFEMYYQPIYSTVEKKFVSAEALVRLRDEKYGYISPSLFIPAAEDSGLIHELGDFIFRSVFKFISENEIEQMGLKYVEINLSSAQCIEVELVDKIKEMLDEYGVSAKQISMEITEIATDINPAIADQNIRRLHELGIRFALDDYGTGYSNIRRVTSLPFDQVKLDKAFVDEIDNPLMWNTIKDTILMFKEMGKEVLVEGVEEEHTARKVLEFNTDLIQGCELMQGFFFCRPMPEMEFVSFMKARTGVDMLNYRES